MSDEDKIKYAQSVAIAIFIKIFAVIVFVISLTFNRFFLVAGVDFYGWGIFHFIIFIEAVILGALLLRWWPLAILVSSPVVLMGVMLYLEPSDVEGLNDLSPLILMHVGLAFVGSIVGFYMGRNIKNTWTRARQNREK